MVRSSRAAWPVPVFSLLSKNTAVFGSPALAWMTKPKLSVLPAAIQAMTLSVTSTAMYWPAPVTAAVTGLAPRWVLGTLPAETALSLQAEPRVLTSTEPGTPTRLTYRTKVALSKFDASVRSGKVDRSKRSSVLAPAPTLSVAVAP